MTNRRIYALISLAAFASSLVALFFDGTLALYLLVMAAYADYLKGSE